MPRSNSKETPIAKLSYEEAHSRLEETMRALEAGSLTLQDATRRYEEGVRLARRCNELLSQAELRISYLQTSYGEQMGLLKEEKEEDAEG
jgi:exodeoxyribonuclease VII small subunit